MRIRYIDVAPAHEETRPLLMVHGHTGRLEEYEEMLPTLAKNRRVIILDLPGSGLSEKPDRAYSLKLYEDTILQLLDARGVQLCDVAGGSLGGNLVLRLGHREEQRFARLAAWAPAGVWEPARIYAFLIKLLGGNFLFWPSLKIQSRYWYMPTWPGRSAALAQSFSYYRQVFSRGFVRMYWDIGRDQMLQSLFPLAKAIAQPTFVAWGDQDHGMGMGVGVKKLMTLLPRGELKVFAGARHSLAQEVPEELAQAVDEFLLRKIAADVQAA